MFFKQYVSQFIVSSSDVKRLGEERSLSYAEILINFLTLDFGYGYASLLLLDYRYCTTD